MTINLHFFFLQSGEIFSPLCVCAQKSKKFLDRPSTFEDKCPWLSRGVIAWQQTNIKNFKLGSQLLPNFRPFIWRAIL